MLWFFHNGSRKVRVETRYDPIAAEYVAIVHWPDRVQQEEHFRDVEAFRRHLVAIEHELAAGQYMPAGAPTMLFENWLRRDDRSNGTADD